MTGAPRPPSYAVFVAYVAVSANPVAACNPTLRRAQGDTLSIVLGLTVTALSLSWTAVRASGAVTKIFEAPVAVVAGAGKGAAGAAAAADADDAAAAQSRLEEVIEARAPEPPRRAIPPAPRERAASPTPSDAASSEITRVDAFSRSPSLESPPCRVFSSRRRRRAELEEGRRAVASGLRTRSARSPRRDETRPEVR